MVNTIYDIFAVDYTNQSPLRTQFIKEFGHTPNTYLSETYIEVQDEKYDLFLDDIINLLKKNIKEEILREHIFYKKNFCVFILVLNEVIISTDITTDSVRVEILYTHIDKLDKKLNEHLKEYLKQYEEKKELRIGFNLFMNNGGEPYLYFNEILDKYDISIDENYNDDFVEENKIILNSLKETGTSLCLFHGEPGCGKTHYIRYLISHLCKINKKVIYFPNEHIHFLSDPAFLHFFKEHKNSIVIIEDAEEILVSREFTQNSRGISNLLNLTDGLMGDFLQLKFVCTFNTTIDRIDKALLRKGRITTNYKFEKLSVDKSNSLLKKLDKNYVTTQPMTLADIYNLEQKDNTEKKTNKIGF